jgi:hypothetical protein
MDMPSAKDWDKWAAAAGEDKTYGGWINLEGRAVKYAGRGWDTLYVIDADGNKYTRANDGSWYTGHVPDHIANREDGKEYLLGANPFSGGSKGDGSKGDGSNGDETYPPAGINQSWLADFLTKLGF